MQLKCQYCQCQSISVNMCIEHISDWMLLGDIVSSLSRWNEHFSSLLNASPLSPSVATPAKVSKEVSKFMWILILLAPGNFFSMVLFQGYFAHLRRKRRAGWFYACSINDRKYIVRKANHSEGEQVLPTGFIAYVDFKVAFDSIDRGSLSNIHSNTGLQSKHFHLLRVLHLLTEGCVPVNGRHSTSFPIKKEVRKY